MITWLEPCDRFPPVSAAMGADSQAPGLLAASAALTPSQLLSAYRQGIFPWYAQGQPVLWWTPDPRMILVPSRLRITASMRKTLKKVLRDERWAIHVDTDFSEVMRCCALAQRPGQQGTWITDAIIAAYSTLYTQGMAHSVEVWFANQRVGGLYGVALGRMFYGESMFAQVTDASKIALAALCAFLCKHEVQMIDCQQQTAHLASMGAIPIAREAFLSHLQLASRQTAIENWQFDKSVLQDWF